MVFFAIFASICTFACAVVYISSPAQAVDFIGIHKAGTRREAVGLSTRSV